MQGVGEGRGMNTGKEGGDFLVRMVLEVNPYISVFGPGGFKKTPVHPKYDPSYAP